MPCECRNSKHSHRLCCAFSQVHVIEHVSAAQTLNESVCVPSPEGVRLNESVCLCSQKTVRLNKCVCLQPRDSQTDR